MWWTVLYIIVKMPLLSAQPTHFVVQAPRCTKGMAKSYPIPVFRDQRKHYFRSLWMSLHSAYTVIMLLINNVLHQYKNCTCYHRWSNTGSYQHATAKPHRNDLSHHRYGHQAISTLVHRIPSGQRVSGFRLVGNWQRYVLRELEGKVQVQTAGSTLE